MRKSVLGQMAGAWINGPSNTQEDRIKIADAAYAKKPTLEKIEDSIIGFGLVIFMCIGVLIVTIVEKVKKWERK